MPATATIKTRSIQAEALSAASDRLVNTILLSEGVVGKAANSFKVAQNLGTDMNVKVGSGTAYDRAAVQGDNAGQGVYIVEHQNATQVLAVAAADATNPRIDIVILRVYDDPFDSSGNSYADLEVITGTPAGSPSAPAVPSSAVKLAEVAVAAGATAIVNADITDTRVEAAASGLLQAARSLTTLSETRAGMLGFDDTNDVLQIGLGAAVASVGVGAWKTWTPTWTNVTVGNGTVTARYVQIGKVVHCELVFTLGSTSDVSGDVNVSRPVATTPPYATLPVGIAQCVDASAGVLNQGVVWSSTATEFKLRVFNAASTYLTITALSSTVPFTWAESDVLTFTATYEVV